MLQSVHQLQCRAVPRDALLMEEDGDAAVSITIGCSSRCGEESSKKCDDDDDDEIILGDTEQLPVDRRRKEVIHHVNDLTESPEPAPKKRNRMDP